MTCTWELVVFDTLTCEGRAGGTVCCVWEDEKGKGDIMMTRLVNNSLGFYHTVDSSAP